MLNVLRVGKVLLVTTMVEFMFLIETLVNELKVRFWNELILVLSTLIP